jgi:GxxExxY protein
LKFIKSPEPDFWKSFIKMRSSTKHGKKILNTKEKEYLILYKETILRHRFYADFVVFDKIIVEIKAKERGIAEEDFAQTLNYLKCSGCKVGLILNFARLKLEIKRVVF